MRRWHLFELEDQPWFPQVLRSHMMDWLAATYRFSPLPPIWAGYIAQAIPPDGVLVIIDLASGRAGPIPLVTENLAKRGCHVQVILTDLHPHSAVAAAGSKWISYWPEPVDATQVPPQLTGVRTMFTALHHFPPEAASLIFRSAFEQNVWLFAFESTSRTPVSILLSLLIPIAVLLMTPWMRPFSWSRLLWTYAMPILPLAIFWDGLVSQMRAYSQLELKSIAKPFSSDQYEWETGEINARGVPVALPYIIGRPATRASR